MRWYSAAAREGDPYAQNNLGLCYLNGWGGVQNPVEAVKVCISNPAQVASHMLRETQIAKKTREQPLPKVGYLITNREKSRKIGNEEISF